MTPFTSLRYRFAICAAAATLVLGLSACAPEPDPGGNSVPTEVAGQGGKDTATTPGESSWGQPNDGVDVEQRNTELPVSFPSNAFVIPASVEIYDAGERGEGVWYLLLVAPGESDADTVWGDVIQLSGFTVSDETVTPEGGQSASLSNAALHIVAVTLPQADGTVQLSYDIRRIG